MATTVEVLADAFKEAGTPFIVGHPGGESVELIDAARQRNMPFLLMKQEVAGAMLASTWGEITGSPGVCLSTRGPGAANMVNGIAYASLDRAPLIAITDQYSAPTYATGLRQKIDQIALYAPLVKWGTTINAKTVRQQVRRAMREATGMPPGPVQFDMPQSETTREAGDGDGGTPLLPNLLVPEPDRASLKAPLDMLAKRAQADHPGRPRRPLEPRLRRADRLRRAARRAGPDHHEMQGRDLGGPSAAGRLHHRRPHRAQARQPSRPDRRRRPRHHRAAAQGVALQHSGPGPLRRAEHGRRRAGAARGGRRPQGAPRPPRRVGARRLRLGRAGGACLPRRGGRCAQHAGDGLSPQRAMEVARAILPRETIATCDAGASRLLVVQKWEAYGPREFLTSNGLGSMGYAIPGALGARLAYPDRPVVAFTGDGGFLMAVAELQTSMRENLPIIVIVFDDEEIGLIRVKQEIKGIPLAGVKLGGIQWDKLAQGFGADGVVVNTEQAFGDALQGALSPAARPSSASRSTAPVTWRSSTRCGSCERGRVVDGFRLTSSLHEADCRPIEAQGATGPPERSLRRKPMRYLPHVCSRPPACWWPCPPPRRPRTIRPGPCASSSRSRPAAATTSSAALWRRS